MVAGSTDADGDATAINTGNITVNNAGFGMMARMAAPPLTVA